MHLVFRTILAVLAALALAAPAAASERLVISGSTSLLPLTLRAAEAYMRLHPDLRISVDARGTLNGTRALLDGLADLAGASRETWQRELAWARKRGMELVSTPVARGCVVCVVDPSNPVKGLSLAQLRDIYTGRIRSWKEVGGLDHDIAVLSRDFNSGTYSVFRDAVLGKERVRPDALMLASNGAMHEAVAGNPRAIGYLSISYLTPKVKALALDGQLPTPAAVDGGTYLLSRELYMLSAGPPKGAAARFLEFLRGPSGQDLARQEGYLPLNGSATPAAGK